MVVVGAIAVAILAERLARRITNRRLAQGVNIVATGVTGTVAILRRRSWRVLGTWVDLLGAIGALWASLIAVGDHVAFAIVAMGYLIGQFAQVIPVPGGVGTIDAGVTGALVLYDAPTTITTAATAGELISHGIALLVPLLTGALAFVFLPREIAKARARSLAATCVADPRPAVNAGGRAAITALMRGTRGLVGDWRVRLRAAAPTSVLASSRAECRRAWSVTDLGRDSAADRAGTEVTSRSLRPHGRRQLVRQFEGRHTSGVPRDLVTRFLAQHRGCRAYQRGREAPDLSPDTHRSRGSLWMLLTSPIASAATRTRFRLDLWDFSSCAWRSRASHVSSTGDGMRQLRLARVFSKP
jgi:hypothetical protein